MLSLLFRALSQYLMSCRLFPLGRESDDRVVWSSDEPLFVCRARSHSRFPERSRARAVGDHFLARRTDPPLLKVQYQRRFLSFISGQVRSSSVALGNAPLLPFLGVSPLFLSLSPPSAQNIPKQPQKSLLLRVLGTQRRFAWRLLLFTH